MQKLALSIVVLFAATGLVIVSSLSSALSAANQTGPTLRVLAGLGRGIVSVNQYAGDPAFPEGGTVKVAEGTTVIWNLGSDEPHTVTFRAGAPWPMVIMPQPEDPSRAPMYNPQLVNPTLPDGPWDGTSFLHMELQSPGDEMRVTFSRAGRYRYSCLFHEEMDGYLEVVAPGSEGISTQADVDRFAASHYADEHGEYNDRMLADRSRPSRIDGPGGASLWFVRAGTNERRGHVDLNGFLPDTLSVAPGDTIIWYVDHDIPHTVTFPAVGGAAPNFVALQLPDGRLVPPPAPGQAPDPALMEAMSNQASPPRLVYVGAVPNRPTPSYDGARLYNSGLIGEHPLISYPMEKTWALTFDTPGVYQYLCLLHEPTGMKGTITVLAR